MSKETTPSRLFLKTLSDDVTGRKRPTNYVEALLLTINGYISTEIFAMGVAFAGSGLLVGPTLLVAVALLCLHCQRIIVEACERVSEREAVEVQPSYAETVRYTLQDSSSRQIRRCAEFAGVTTDLFVLVVEYGEDIVHLIFISTHVKQLADVHGWTVSYRIWLAIMLVPLWLPVFLTNLKLLSPLSLLADLFTWAAVAIILYYTATGLPSIRERHLGRGVRHLPLLFGITLSGFKGATFILNIRTELRDRRRFEATFGVLNVSMAIVTALYATVGFMSLWKYGHCVAGSILLNLPNTETLSQTITALTVVSVMISYILHMYIPFEISFPIFHKHCGPFRRPFLTMALYRTSCILVTFAIANIDSRLEDFIGFFGGLAGSVVTLILPALLDVAMRWDTLTPWTILRNVLIVTIATIEMAMVAMLSIEDITNHLTGTNDTLPVRCL